LQAKNEKLKRVTQAEAAAAERQLSADAEAYSTEVQSKARAEAIRREADALKQSPDLIRLRTVERWDGVLPRVNGSQMVPFLNIGSEVEQQSPDSLPARRSEFPCTASQIVAGSREVASTRCLRWASISNQSPEER
jgi:hypothetical protein